MHQAYDACRQALQERLAREKQGEDTPPPRFANQTRHDEPGRNTAADDRHESQYRRHSGTVTQNPLRAKFSLARRQRIDPRRLSGGRFGVGRIDDFSIREASGMIDELKRNVPTMRA